MKSKEHYEARAKIAKALAHPSRLLILEVLQENEQCVCELTDLVGADQSTVSKHLAILKNAGLVQDRKEGTMVFYRAGCTCITGFFSCIETVLKDNLKAQKMAIAG